MDAELVGIAAYASGRSTFGNRWSELGTDKSGSAAFAAAGAEQQPTRWRVSEKSDDAIGDRPGRTPSRPSVYGRDSEEQVVARARAGDQTAMGLLLRQHDGAMRALAWKILGDQSLMDDALQDAYLRACRSIAKFRGNSQFGTWLHRVVANSCIGCLRTRARRKEQELFDASEAVTTEQRFRIDDVELIQQALQGLSDEQRAALLLVDCEGYSYKEVADLFHTSAGTVGSWVSRARSAVRRSEVFS